MKSLIVLPSYNEKENIVQLATELINISENIDVCIVDDNSPDGTGPIVDQFIATTAKKDRVYVIHRQKKDGRGGAVRDGFRWGLEQSQKNYQSFIEMDCDFSHHPRYIEQGLKMLTEYDVVLGSRYPDGEIVGWPLKRTLLSFFANFLARTLISWKISDYTNGFRFYTRSATQKLIELPQKHKGYIYLSESLSYLLKDQRKIGRFPIVFVNRERGYSNTTFQEVFRSFSGIFKIAYDYRFK